MLASREASICALQTRKAGASERNGAAGSFRPVVYLLNCVRIVELRRRRRRGPLMQRSHALLDIWTQSGSARRQASLVALAARVGQLAILPEGTKSNWAKLISSPLRSVARAGERRGRQASADDISSHCGRSAGQTQALRPKPPPDGWSDRQSN